jgi:RNA polymerase sigma-70 factor (ECF subfamily)
MPASNPASMTLSDLERTDDAELVAAVTRGDAAAFAALFHRRRGDVYRFALHMTGSPAAADDVTQEVFLAVIRDAGRYESGRATVTAWLCGIARNHARRRAVREQGLMPLLDEAGPRQQGMPVVEVDPVAEMARIERVEAVRRAVLRLPFKYREVIVLCDLQEMSYGEAAGTLGCAVGTVRSRLHRGRALLAQKLASIDGRPTSWKAEGSGCFA